MGDALVEVVSEVSSGDGELLSGDGRAWRAMLCVAGGDGSAEERRQGGQWPEGEIRAGEGDERESGIVAEEEGVFGGSWQGPEERLKRRSDGMMDPYPLVTKGPAGWFRISISRTGSQKAAPTYEPRSTSIASGGFYVCDICQSTV